MTTRSHRRGMVLTAVLVASLGRAAYGDPVCTPCTPGCNTPAPCPTTPPPPDFIHLTIPWHLTTDGGTKLDLPPSYILSEPKWNTFDAEMKRLQDSETRFTAENKILKADLEKWQPGIITLGAAVISGVALGWYLHEKI